MINQLRYFFFTLKNFSKILKKFQEERNLSDLELAKELGLTVKYLKQLENGWIQPSLRILKQILDRLER